jgi:hypothetical protein
VLDVSSSLLLLGVLFGSIGLGFFIYGRKQSGLAPLVCGLLLMVVPYFISNALLLFAVGAVLVVLPYFVRV